MPWNPAVPPPPVTGAPDGTWLDGTWLDGTWLDGTWLDGGTVTVCVTVTPGCGLDAADAAPEDTPGVPDECGSTR